MALIFTQSECTIRNFSSICLPPSKSVGTPLLKTFFMRRHLCASSPEADDAPMATPTETNALPAPLVSLGVAASCSGQMGEKAKSPPTRRERTPRATPYSMSQGRWRKRPNHELEYLRGKVTDLEEELAVLRQSDERPALVLMGDASEDDDDVAGRWKRIADRQSEEANAALLENLKLRAMLEGQIQVARCLEAAIDQQQRKAAGALPWQSNGRGRSRATSLSDELLFGLLDENMESQYSEIDAVLEASGLTHVNKELLGKIEVQQDAHGVSFHTGEVRVLPFSVPSMLRAISKFLSHGMADGRMVRCHKFLQEGDYQHATTVVQLQMTRSRRVKVKSRLVQRRFSEPDREVIVWIAYVEIEGSVFVRLQERGWVSLTPFHFRRRGAPDSSSPGCIMRTVVRVMPETTEFESEDETQTHVGEMTDLVVGTYHRNFGLMYQVLENLLVSDAMSGAEADEAASSSA